MKLKILVTIALLIHCFDAQAQDSLANRSQPFIIRDLSSKTKINQPLYIIKFDNKTCYVPSRRFSNSRKIKRVFKNFKVDWIHSIDILKEKNATEKYGSLGKYGVIILNMKNGTYDMLPRKLKKGCR